MATWRDHPYTYAGYLYLDRPEVIFKARVNQSSFTYPLTAVTIDTITVGSASDLIEGRTVLFGTTDGADDLGRTYVRRGGTSISLKFGESSNGNLDGEVNLANNIFITVLNEYRVWAVAPRIDDDDVIYKYYDIELVDSGRNYGSRPGPIPNGGCSKIALVNTGTGLATFQFSAADAYMVTPSSTKTGQTWAVKDGTITVGTTTSEAITATFPVGRRYVELTVTDSAGDSATRYILVVALSLTDATWKPIQDFEIVSPLRLLPDGAEMSVLIHETLAPNTFPDGAAILYFEREFYNDVEGSLSGPTSAEGVKFVGWSDMEGEGVESTFQGLQNGVEIRCISTAARLRQINLLPQQVEEDATPDDWTEMLTLTNHRLIFYLLRWHSTVLKLAPLLFNEDLVAEVSLAGWNTAAADLYGQADEIAQAVAARLTCDQRGQLRHEYDPNLLQPASRTEEVFETLTEDDYDVVDLERERFPRDYWVDGSGIIAGEDGDPVFCIAPGSAPGQGAQRSDFAKQIVSSQTTLNQRVGHYYAKINAPYQPITLKLHNWGDIGIDPALMKWLTVTLGSTTNRRNRSFSETRLLPIETSISYSIDEQGRRQKEVEVTCVVETEGEPATTVIHPKGDANYPPITLPVITFPTFDFNFGNFGRGIGNVAAFNSNGTKMRRTANFYVPSSAGGPHWAEYDFSGDLNGANIIDFAVDQFSPLYLGTGTAVNGWILGGGSGTGNGIYRITDIFGTPVITLRHTLRPYIYTLGTIVSPGKLGNQNRVYAAYRTRAGVYYSYTTDDSTYTKGPQVIGGVSIGGSLEALSIPVDGTTVTTATTLTNGTYYLLRVTGTATKNAVGPLLMDAVYHESPTPGTWIQSNNAVGSNLIVAGSATSEDNISVSDVYDGATHSYDFILLGTGATRTLGARQYGGTQSGTWSANLYPFNYPTAQLNAPGLHGSSLTDGLVYVSAFAGAAGDGYVSSNHGSTFSALGTPDINPDDNLAGAIYVPNDNNSAEYVVYHGLYDATGPARKLIRIESDGTTKTDISPTISGTKYGPISNKQVATYAQDRRYVMLAGQNPLTGGSITNGLFISSDYGTTWTTLQSTALGGFIAKGCLFATNNYKVLYLWGSNFVGYSEDFGVTIDSRVGDQETPFNFCALVGG